MTNDDSFVSPLPLPHMLADTPVPPKTAAVGPDMRTDSSQQEVRSQSLASRPAPPSATMSGFYFHQNSEPYVMSCFFYLRPSLTDIAS